MHIAHGLGSIYTPKAFDLLTEEIGNPLSFIPQDERGILALYRWLRADTHRFTR